MKAVEVVQINEAAPKNYNYTIELHNRYYNSKIDDLSLRAVKTFMRLLRGYIAIKTNLCYNIPDIGKDCSITIPVDVLSNEDTLTHRELITKKIHTLKRFLEKDINYDSFLSQHKAALAAISLYHFDYSRMLYISSPQLKNIININMKPSTIKPMKIIYHRYSGDLLLEIINPYFVNSFIALDLSTPYDEMGISYNALHVYEHLMCSPWIAMKNTAFDNIDNLNGLTTSLGNCFVYVEAKDKPTMKKCISNQLNWIYESRDEGFWGKHKSHVEKEITRTISETKGERNYIQFARSPGTAYDYKYDLELFRYWSNKPLKMLVAHPYDAIDLNEFKIRELLSNHPIRNITKPEIPTFKYYPYSAIAGHPRINRITKKLDKKEICKIFEDYYINGKIIDGEFGVDVQSRDINMKETYFKDRNFGYFPIQGILGMDGIMDEHTNQRVIVRHICACLKLSDLVEPYFAYSWASARAMNKIANGMIDDGNDNGNESGNEVDNDNGNEEDDYEENEYKK